MTVAAGQGHALGQRRAKLAVQVVDGVQRMDVDPVGHLAGGADHQVVDRGDVQPHVLEAVTSRHAGGRQQAHPVEPALVGQRSVAAERGPARPHRQHVVTEPGDGRVELRAVAALDVGPNLAAESEPEPPLGGLGELPCDLGRDHRAAREGDRDAGRQVQARRRLVGGGDRQPRRLAHLGEHEAGEAGLLDLRGEVLDVGPGGRFGHHVELHRPILSSARRAPVVRPSDGSHLVGREAEGHPAGVDERLLGAERMELGPTDVAVAPLDDGGLEVRALRRRPPSPGRTPRCRRGRPPASRPSPRRPSSWPVSGRRRRCATPRRGPTTSGADGCPWPRPGAGSKGRRRAMCRRRRQRRRRGLPRRRRGRRPR